MATRGQDRRVGAGAPEGRVARGSRRLGGLLRRLPLAASAAAQRFAEDPARGRAALERALPRTAGRRGQPGDAAATLDRAVAQDRYEEALRSLADVPAAERPGAELAVAGLAGRLHDVARADATDARGHRAVRNARRVLGELAQPLPSHCGVHADRGTSAESPRVVHVVTNSLPLVQAGSTIRTQRVARAQRDAGWDAHVVTRPGFPVTRGEMPLADTEYVDGVPYHRLLPAVMPRRDRMSDAYARLLGRTVDVVRPDLLHAASDYANARAALEVGRRLGLPVAYEARSFFEDTWLSRHGNDTSADTYQLLRARHTDILLAADVVTTLGEAMRTEIIARGVSAERVFVTPNAVPAEFLDARDPAARQRLGLEATPFLVGSLATLNDDEGFGVLLESLALLRADGVDARALLVGDGPAADALREQAHSLGVPAIMPGRVPVGEVLPWYDALDVFAFPRLDTALNRTVTGLKPVEAQARGLPVVGSALPAVAEVLAPGQAQVAPGDAAALAAALASLVDGAERDQRGGSAREWVAQTRTWPRVVETYRAAYAFG